MRWVLSTRASSGTSPTSSNGKKSPTARSSSPSDRGVMPRPKAYAGNTYVSSPTLAVRSSSIRPSSDTPSKGSPSAPPSCMMPPTKPTARAMSAALASTSPSWMPSPTTTKTCARRHSSSPPSPRCRQDKRPSYASAWRTSSSAIPRPR